MSALGVLSGELGDGVGDHGGLESVHGLGDGGGRALPLGRDHADRGEGVDGRWGVPEVGGGRTDREQGDK